MMLGITGSMWGLWSSGADYATLLPAIVGGVGGLWVLFGGWKTISVVIKTLPRDLKAVSKLVRLGLHVKRAERQNLTVPKVFKRTVDRSPQKVMFHFQDEEWTFQQVEDYSNQVAHYFLSLGLGKGDTIAVFMENRPEFVATWLGIAKIGAVPALVNYNLRADALVHSVAVVSSSCLVYSASLAPAVSSVFATLRNGAKAFPTYCTGAGRLGDDFVSGVPGTVDLDKERELQPVSEVPQEIQDSIGFRDRLMYIYTSGTTGMPKAAVIKHARYILASGGLTIMIGVRKEDTVYCPLPLYHSVGGMISLSGCMAGGITMVIRDKFSASNYWKDCVKYKVTAAQYIGEICRYLINSPSCPEENTHQVRMMFGNGLRPDIWTQFVSRFGIQDISEFYGSTEGNSNIINFDNTVGAVGFVPVLFAGILPLGPIKVTEEGEAVRDPETGLCVRCKVGEPGEFVGIIQQHHPVREFTGYSDRDATEKKILRNVWSKGDLCFRSGDILVSDELGYLYFKDRKGDTFRWKGENVSTTEVESVVSKAGGLVDCVVYGVEVGNSDGRAGMAAVAGEIDLEHLAKEVVKQLPSYARPVFLRLASSLDITGTYKLKKRELQSEGCDPSKISDPLFLLHPKTRTYVPLDSALYQDLEEGKIRL